MRGDPRVAVYSLGRMGLGLNWIKIDAVIPLKPKWNEKKLIIDA